MGQGPWAGGHGPGAMGRGPWTGGHGPGAVGREPKGIALKRLKSKDRSSLEAHVGIGPKNIIFEVPFGIVFSSLL